MIRTPAALPEAPGLKKGIRVELKERSGEFVNYLSSRRGVLASFDADRMGVASFELQSGLIWIQRRHRKEIRLTATTQNPIHINSPRSKVPAANRPIFSRIKATTIASAAAWRGFIL